MRIGTLVKIPDIGELAKVIQTGGQMIKIEIFGEQMWIERRLVEVVG